METWKDVPGYEGIYQASSEGRIKTVEGKITKNSIAPVRKWKSRILKTRGKACSGYRVSLWKDGKVKDALVARVVAQTFLGEPKMEGATVNHIDGNRFNNKIENLEWMSRSDNIKYGFANGQYEKLMKQTQLQRIDSNEVYKFESQAQANRFLGKNHGYINTAIKRNRKIVYSKSAAYKIL